MRYVCVVLGYCNGIVILPLCHKGRLHTSNPHLLTIFAQLYLASSQTSHHLPLPLSVPTANTRLCKSCQFSPNNKHASRRKVFDGSLREIPDGLGFVELG